MESVWSFPQGPAFEAERRPVRVEHGGVVVAETGAAVRVLERGLPPAFYIPPQDVRTDLLQPCQVLPVQRQPCLGRREGTDDAEQEEDLMRTSQIFQDQDIQRLHGRTVMGSNGFKIGKVQAVYLDDETEQPEWLAVKTGWFGGRLSFLPLETVRETAGNDGILEPAEEDELYRLTRSSCSRRRPAPRRSCACRPPARRREGFACGSGSRPST